MNRHKEHKFQPREDGLCFCGCDQPALPGFAFASESCRKRQHRREYKETHKETNITKKSESVVIVYDPVLGDEPYKETMYWFNLYKKDLHEMGIKVTGIDGVELML